MLGRLIPKRYHSQFLWSELTETALLIFHHKRKETITSAFVREALNSIGNPKEPFKIAVGDSFTHEAAAILATSGFRVTVKQKPKAVTRKPADPFPERVDYVCADGSEMKMPDWNVANWQLRYLDPSRRPFMVFALPNGSFIQCLGSKQRLTVEARECRPDGSFTHWVFGRGRPQREPVQIKVSTGQVTLDVSQVLTMRQARPIIRQFLETRTFPAEFHRQDVTHRFTSGHNA
jgi:hypothetical protein